MKKDRKFMRIFRQELAERGKPGKESGDSGGEMRELFTEHACSQKVLYPER